MQKLSIIIWVACGFLVTAASAHLKNISFENPDANPAKPAHWGVWGDKLERVTEWRPTLEGDAMIAYKHWELSGSHTASSGIFQDADHIEAGRTYEFTLGGYADAPDWGSLGGRLEIRLESTVNGQQVFLDRESVPFDAFLGEWRKMTIRATPPVDNLRAVVEFFPASGGKGGAIKIDLTDISLANTK
jgi:hypothetical protein